MPSFRAPRGLGRIGWKKMPGEELQNLPRTGLAQGRTINPSAGSADFESAVSPNSIRLAGRSLAETGTFHGLRIVSPRYNRMKSWATKNARAHRPGGAGKPPLPCRTASRCAVQFNALPAHATNLDARHTVTLPVQRHGWLGRVRSRRRWAGWSGRWAGQRLKGTRVLGLRQHFDAEGLFAVRDGGAGSKWHERVTHFDGLSERRRSNTVTRRLTGADGATLGSGWVSA